MYCKLCDKLILNKNKYDIIHNEFVCIACIENHSITESIELSSFQELIPEKTRNKRSLMPTIFNVLAIILTIYFLFDPMTFYYPEYNVIFVRVLIVCVLFGMAKIIRILESLELK